MRITVRHAPAPMRAAARRAVIVLALLTCALGAIGCASPEHNPYYRDRDPTSGHLPDFVPDGDGFMRPSSIDR